MLHYVHRHIHLLFGSGQTVSIQSRLWVLRATRNETVKLQAIKPKQRAERDWNLVERIDTKIWKLRNTASFTLLIQAQQLLCCLSWSPTRLRDPASELRWRRDGSTRDTPRSRCTHSLIKTGKLIHTVWLTFDTSPTNTPESNLRFNKCTVLIIYAAKFTHFYPVKRKKKIIFRNISQHSFTFAF